MTIFRSLLVLLLFLAPKAEALPTMADHWRFGCAPNGYSKKLMAKAKGRSSKGGPGLLHYACVQSALEVFQYEKQLRKFQDGGGKGVAPKLSQSRSVGLLKQASRKLAAAYKRSPKNMNIAYLNGYALALLKDDWAVNRLDEVIRSAPRSKAGADASMAMAELYFDIKGPTAATTYYQKAMKGKNKINQSYARYKLGWTEYLVGMQTKQREKQKRAIGQLARLSQSLSTKRGALKALSEKAKADVLDLVVDFGDMEEAKRILRSVKAADVYATMLERMAYVKLEQGDINSAYKMFSQVIKENPKNPENVQISINLIGLAAQMNNVPLIVRLIKIVMSKYIQPKAKWRKIQKKPHLKKMDALMETTAFEYAATIDREGRDKNMAAYLDHAYSVYKLYEKYFPKGKNIYEAKYYSTQIIDQKGKYKEAAQAYYDLVKADPKNKNTKDALDLMITAAQNLFDQDKKKYNFPAPGSIKKPIKLPESKRVYAQSLELYAKMVPRDPNAGLMNFTSAGIHYDFGHYKEGVKSYLRFVKKYPRDPNAKMAAARIFEYYRQQKTDKEYIKIRNRLAEVPGMKSSPEMAPYFALPEKKKKKRKKKKKKSSDDQQQEQQEQQEDQDQQQEQQQQ